MKNVFLPDKKEKGTPFYCLMEAKNGELTGSYYMTDQSSILKKVFMLFISPVHAERYIKLGGLEKEFEARAFKQETFDLIINIVRMEKGIFGIVFSKDVRQFIPLEPDDLKKEYYI